MDLAPLFYQYGLGLFVVLAGLWACFRTGVIRRNRLWLVILLGGWVLLFALQAGLQLSARAASTTMQKPHEQSGGQP